MFSTLAGISNDGTHNPLQLICAKTKLKAKTMENVNKNNRNWSIINKTLNLDNSVEEKKLKKSFYFYILRWKGLIKNTTHNSLR